MYFGSEGSQGLRAGSSAYLGRGSSCEVQLPHYKRVVGDTMHPEKDRRKMKT